LFRINKLKYMSVFSVHISAIFEAIAKAIPSKMSFIWTKNTSHI